MTIWHSPFTLEDLRTKRPCLQEHIGIEFIGSITPRARSGTSRNGTNRVSRTQKRERKSWTAE